MDRRTLSQVFQLCDKNGKGYITSSDLKTIIGEVEANGQGQQGFEQILGLLKIGSGLRMDFEDFCLRVNQILNPEEKKQEEVFSGSNVEAKRVGGRYISCQRIAKEIKSSERTGEDDINEALQVTQSLRVILEQNREMKRDLARILKHGECHSFCKGCAKQEELFEVEKAFRKKVDKENAELKNQVQELNLKLKELEKKSREKDGEISALKDQLQSRKFEDTKDSTADIKEIKNIVRNIRSQDQNHVSELLDHRDHSIKQSYNTMALFKVLEMTLKTNCRILDFKDGWFHESSHHSRFESSRIPDLVPKNEESIEVETDVAFEAFSLEGPTPEIIQQFEQLHEDYLKEVMKSKRLEKIRDDLRQELEREEVFRDEVLSQQLCLIKTIKKVVNAIDITATKNEFIKYLAQKNAEV